MKTTLEALDALQVLVQVCWRTFTTRDTASPKVWIDAHLAAFAVAGKLRLVTLDRDFKNFVFQGLDLTLLV
jgi:uncharacterized protein